MDRPTVLFGTDLRKTLPPKLTGSEIVQFGGSVKVHDETKACSFGLTPDNIHTHLLSVGATGSGKSTVMKQVLKQMLERKTEKDTIIIFDVGGEYKKKFYKNTNPDHLILGSDPAALRWDIFAELMDQEGNFDNKSYSQIHELAKSIFEPYENHHQPFFTLAPKDIMVSVLSFFVDYAKSEADASYPFLQDIIDILGKWGPDQLIEMFESTAYEGLIKSYLGDGRSDQALGVMSELRTVINDVFQIVQNYSEKAEPFCMRHMMREGGKVCFIEYDVSLSKTQATLLRVWYDLAIKYALSDESERSKRSGNVSFFCDELALLPNLGYLSNALNFGRKHNIFVYSAIQSVSQLEVVYGAAETQSILAGFCNVFFFRCFEKASRTYIADRLGKTRFLIVLETPLIMDGTVVEDADILQLSPGDAIVHLNNHDPFRFHFNDDEKEGEVVT